MGFEKEPFSMFLTAFSVSFIRDFHADVLCDKPKVDFILICYIMFFMNIDEAKLLDLLSKRAKYFKSHFDIITSFLALLSYIVTMIFTCLSIEVIPTYAKVFGIALLAFYLLLFIWTIYYSRYSLEAFYADITKCSDDHKFSLVILKDNQNRFLLKYDKRWKTYLFPYLRTTAENEKSVLNFVIKNIGFQAKRIIKELEKEETKHSVSNNMTKTYHHTFCEIEVEPFEKKNVFKFNGSKFKWFSFDEMKCDKKIMERNAETVKFVEENF